MDVRVTLVRRERNDTRVREFGSNGLGCLRAPQHRHAEVHQRDVGTMNPEQLNGLSSIRRLGHELEVLVEGEQRRQTITKNRVVVDRHHPDCGGCCR